MSKKFCNAILQGTEEARAYMEGARDGYRVTRVAVHEMRKGDFRVQAGGENRTEDRITNTGKGEQAQNEDHMGQLSRPAARRPNRPPGF